MLKEGVRLDRVRGGRQKYRRMMDNPYNSRHHFNQQEAPKSLDENKILQVLQSCEPETILATPGHLGSAPNGKRKTIKTLSDLYERQLVGIVDWAKQIPGM